MAHMTNDERCSAIIICRLCAREDVLSLEVSMKNFHSLSEDTPKLKPSNRSFAFVLLNQVFSISLSKVRLLSSSVKAWYRISSLLFNV